MTTRRLSGALDALTRHGVDDPDILRDLLEAVLVVGQGVELDQSLQRIVEVASEVLDARYGALGVRAPAGGLSEFVHIGIDAAERDRMGHLPVGHGVLGFLIEQEDVLRIRDLGDHPASVGFPPNHPPMSTFLGAPIIVRGAVFGSLYLTEKRSADEFSEVDEALVAVLAIAAGIAVDNARLFERARTRHRWMQVIARRGSEPLAGIALSDTLSRLCVDVAALADATDVFVLSGEPDDLQVVAHTGAEVTGDAALPVVGVRTMLPAAEMSGCLVRGDTRWVTIQPMQRAAGSLGSIVIGHANRPAWEEEDASGLAGVAEVASLAIAYAAQQELARDLEVLEDRHRIARDLHDHVIQRLFAIGMSVQTMMAAHAAGSRMDRADADRATSARLEQVAVDLDRTIAQIRTSIFDLQSTGHVHNDATTLRRRVLDIVSELASHAAIAPGVQFAGPVDTVVPEALGPHIDAVLREGLSNALRHADASHIDISVAADDDVLTVEIADDGDGIAADVTYRGLDNLTRRADQCDGTFSVATAPTSGTTLTWSVPLRG